MRKFLIFILFLSFCGGTSESQRTSEQSESNEATQQLESDALELYREQTTRQGVPSFSPLYTGSIWALNKLTGKTYPEPVTETFNEGPWLIQPFDPELFENN